MEGLKVQIGERIREARLLKGFTQKEVAEKLGVSETVVYRYEKGQNFTIESLYKLGQILGVSLEEFVKGI